MKLTDERTGLEVLPADECLALLRGRGLGRVGIVVHERPVVMPVNYVMDGDNVVFRTAEGTKFDAAVRGAFVSFEIDHSDPVYHAGWSVLLSGVAEEVTNEDDLRRLRSLPLEPWAPGTKSHYIRVRPKSLSGRRLRRD